MITFNDATLFLRTGPVFPYCGELEVGRGLITLITGENGSGKSLTLAALASIYGKQSLSIVERVEGSITKDALGSRVSFVRQEPLDNFIARSISDELAIPLLNFDYSEADGRSQIEQVTSQLDLKLELLNRPIQTLSSGEQQLFAIAVAAVIEPDLFLLDEPTSRLDENHTARTLRAIERLAAKAAVVIASHDIEPFVRHFGTQLRVHEVTRSSKGIVISIPPSGTSDSRRTPIVLPGAGPECMKVCPGMISVFHQSRKEPLTSCAGISIRTGVNILFGDNGVGKTLLARCIAGIIPVNALRSHIVSLLGDVGGLLSGLRGHGNLAYVLPAQLDHSAGGPPVSFQKYRRSGYSTFRPAQPSFFLSESTIRNELERFLTFQECSEQLQFLSACGLQPDDDISHLSFGQKKLVMYATLSKNTRLLVLDEPLSALSPRNRNLVIDSMRTRLQESDHKCFLITANTQRDVNAFNQAHGV
jgi:energy-coupling factor transporter ATP-binding protein EcfA2